MGFAGHGLQGNAVQHDGLAAAVPTAVESLVQGQKQRAAVHGNLAGMSFPRRPIVRGHIQRKLDGISVLQVLVTL